MVMSSGSALQAPVGSVRQEGLGKSPRDADPRGRLGLIGDLVLATAPNHDQRTGDQGECVCTRTRVDLGSLLLRRSQNRSPDTEQHESKQFFQISSLSVYQFAWLFSAIGILRIVTEYTSYVNGLAGLWISRRCVWYYGSSPWSQWRPIAPHRSLPNRYRDSGLGGNAADRGQHRGIAIRQVRHRNIKLIQARRHQAGEAGRGRHATDGDRNGIRRQRLRCSHQLGGGKRRGGGGEAGGGWAESRFHRAGSSRPAWPA